HIHPTPRSTLFPYTTLFRSHVLIGAREENRLWHTVRPFDTHHIRLEMRAEAKVCDARRHDARLVQFAGADFHTGADSEVVVLAADRKSTRLNSSHSQISYAV